MHLIPLMAAKQFIFNVESRSNVKEKKQQHTRKRNMEKGQEGIKIRTVTRVEQSSESLTAAAEVLGGGIKDHLSL
jgi:hypothetical protein